MTSRFMLIFAAISGFIFVALGAFGAHVLSKTMGAVEMGWIQTGLEYQAFHTLAILGLAVAMQRRISIWFYWSSVFLALGTVLFSGSLYHIGNGACHPPRTLRGIDCRLPRHFADGATFICPYSTSYA